MVIREIELRDGEILVPKGSQFLTLRSRESGIPKFYKIFMRYCIQHTEERFWQALRNWSGHKFIYASDEYYPPKDMDLCDTFYREGK